MKKVFLDAGHGGKDPGSVGNGLKEKDISLSVTLKVGEILKAHGVGVIYSRTTDEFIDLRKRSDKANTENVDIFVSIHINAFTSATASGIETYSYSNSKNGDRLSKCIYNSIIKNKVYTLERGTKTANFSVLKNTKMPSTLLELGFITNKTDAEILRNRQDELSEAVAKGILDYLEIKYIKEEKEDKSKLYRVQVGAFKRKENAEILAKELKVKGYQAIVV